MGEVVRSGIPVWPDEPVSEALGFVLPTAVIDLSAVADLFRQRLPAESVRVYPVDGSAELVAAFDKKWMVRVLLKGGVRSDAEHMATEDFLRTHPRATEIATCDRLVDVMVADPQASVAAFEVLEAARDWLLGQSGVIAVHPDSGEPL
jgi:hypothetical protein